MTTANCNQELVQSPCIGVCAMSEATGLCEGCYRTIAEIREWWQMEPVQQRQLLEQLEQRQIELAKFD